ncbi:hypothetical protein F4553_002385 [Allocatelliglobosispora scoriae]|uniref:Leucine-rich repeat domain-containing protein n=1 Tax=Allocatelliglobosispora scoriae TaxID=643052 RepID=A0A841BNX9_9ACTN|nr:STM4015 family protein [Allocatelliglobosispora scoriae]MBB5869006.1 hypothetical protein [Allocatelliglobosispora scoriae]
MTINSHITTFAGLPVLEYVDGARADDPAAVAWRIEDPDYDGGDVFRARLAALVAEPWADRITALILGSWGSTYDSAPPLELVIEAAAKLPALTALFIGEITFEECEISWIQQGDITPVLEAFPKLEVLTVRGTEDLQLKPLRHTGLRKLTFEAGGLPAEIVRAVGECDLPALQHLELWLGTDNYGGDATVDDLTHILIGSRLPSLTYLGLRDAEIADLVAAALAGAPIVARLTELDLSLGILSDVGASALLAGQPLIHLLKLDLHHHYISEPVMDRLNAELGEAGVAVDLSDAGDPEDVDERYVAVAE